MTTKIGILTIKALEEDQAHLLWLVEEAVRHGEEDGEDTLFWEGLLKRLQNAQYHPVEPD